VGCQPGGSFNSKRRAKGAVRHQPTEPGEGRRKDHEQASHSQQTGHSKGFWDDDKTVTRL